jgi:hybrid cluster-associated redox disulfide protein
MKKKPITSDLIIADVLDLWPQTVDVFLEHQMSCPGCYMSRFDTLEDAIQIYALAESAFLQELNCAAQAEAKR